jgi:catechol 2,3-dioxygenase-like lactoylglutathione lyase family enzyme
MNPRPVATRGLTHVALAVRDPAASAAFYGRVFGCGVVYQDDDSVQVQTPGTHDVLVFERAPKAGASGGVRHIGFRLLRARDIDAAAAAIRAAGGDIFDQGEFTPGHPYLYFRDPDGYEVEVWFEPPTPFDPA